MGRCATHRRGKEASAVKRRTGEQKQDRDFAGPEPHARTHPWKGFIADDMLERLCELLVRQLL